MAVTLAGSPSPFKTKTPRKRPERKRHPKPRNITGKKQPNKRIPARKTARKKKTDTKKLFSKIKISQKKEKSNHSKNVSGSVGKRQQSLKKSSSESGTENAYLAHVEKKLRNWPAQVSFAGQEIDIWLKIYPGGNFEYKVLKLSGNPDFNRELINYLKQLQNIGFGPHGLGRPYEIEARFVAHD